VLFLNLLEVFSRSIMNGMLLNLLYLYDFIDTLFYFVTASYIWWKVVMT